MGKDCQRAQLKFTWVLWVRIAKGCLKAGKIVILIFFWQIRFDLIFILSRIIYHEKNTSLLAFCQSFDGPT